MSTTATVTVTAPATAAARARTVDEEGKSAAHSIDSMLPTVLGAAPLARSPTLPSFVPAASGVSASAVPATTTTRPTFRRRVSKSLRSLYKPATSEEYPAGMCMKELGVFTALAFAGWVDATAGVLLPAMRHYYDLDFVVVSMLFVGNLVGCQVAAFTTSYLMDHVGFGKAISLAALLGVIPPVMFIPRPPFPVLVVAMTISGLSGSMLDALTNSWTATRPRPHLRLGGLHFVYGLGAFLCPLAAIPFVTEVEGRQGNGVPFSYFYIVTLGLSAVMFVLVTAAFKLQHEPIMDYDANEDPVVDQAQEMPLQELSRRSPSSSAGGQEQDPENIQLKPTSSKEGQDTAGTPQPSALQPAQPQRRGFAAESTTSRFRKVLRIRTVWTLSFFVLLYVGTEVSIGGWSTSYLIEVRDEASVSNFLVSGFWGGIALGRLLLIPVTSWLGDEWAVVTYLGLSIALQLIVWLVPNIIANAVSLALQGFFMGPVYPIMVHVASRKIRPRAIFTPALSLAMSFGAMGSALFPLIIGIAAEAASKGIEILAPILIALLAVQLGLWCLLDIPLPWKRKEQSSVNVERED